MTSVATAVSTVPPLAPRRQIARSCLVVVVVLAITLLLQLTLLGGLEHSSAQERLFDDLRGQLAAGTAPIGPTDADDRVLEIGAPVALLEIPAIGVRQVVVEGTTSAALFTAPGHRRDSPLPGQIGVSVIVGRRAAFGGPFSRLDELDAGDEITVTTGQGTYEFDVLGVRREGDPVPPAPTAGSSRLLLATAGGSPLVPDGVLRVDADLVGTAVVGPQRLYSADTLPRSERLMATDATTLWALALWIQLLIALTVGAVWCWHRWGRAQAWVVFLPILLLVGLTTAGQVAQLLPNLL